MKSLKIKSLLTSLLFLGLISSCVKDDEGIRMENPTEVFYSSDIFGVVTNISDDPITGAVATFKGNTAITDENGVYRFSDVEVGSQHNTVKIEKEGYFENARTFRTAASATLYQKSILQEKSFDHKFQSDSDGLVEFDRVKIQFPANSVVVDKTGEIYSGEVLLAMTQMDPSLERLAELMPGDMSARDDDESISTLESFGMVNVEMQSPTGEKLQIGENQNVEMSYKVSEEFLSQAPAIIDMWSFDFDLGVWIKEGQASLNGDVYTGIVSHFSSWNYDVSAPSVVVSGQVVSNIGNLPFYYVQIHGADNEGGHGTTDDDGQFSGRVEAGVSLTMRILANTNCSQLVHEEDIGPFTTDTDLGVIMVELITEEIIELTGTAVDCELDPVATGIIDIAGNKFPVSDGVIDIIAPVCAVDFVDVRIVDATSLLQTTVPNLSVPGAHDLDQVTVCGEKAFNITIDNIINEPAVFIDDLEARIIVNNSTNTIEGRLNGSTFNTEEGAFIRFDMAIDIFEEKTYDIITAGFSKNNVFYSMDTTAGVGGEGSVTIQSISTNNTGEKVIEGIYSAESIEGNTNESRTITGTYKMVQY